MQLPGKGRETPFDIIACSMRNRISKALAFGKKSGDQTIGIYKVPTL